MSDPVLDQLCAEVLADPSTVGLLLHRHPYDRTGGFDPPRGWAFPDTQ
jgi:hypothetical protein